MKRSIAVFALVFVACTSPRSPEKVHDPKGETSEPIADEPSAPAASQWACASTADCVQTCALGAVSKEWFEKNPGADDCDDGCYENYDKIACQNAECVTLTDSGEVDPSCTKRTKR